MMTVPQKEQGSSKPTVNTGARLVLKITDLNHDGKGVGKHEGFTCFVTGALPQEKVEVSITRVRKSYAEAEFNRPVLITTAVEDALCSILLTMNS